MVQDLLQAINSVTNLQLAVCSKSILSAFVECYSCIMFAHMAGVCIHQTMRK